MICHYLFFNHGFKFQDYVCNGYHDLSLLRLNISDIAIITYKNVDYRCIPDHLKTKQMCTYSGKKLPYLLRYVPNQYKTRKCVIELF